LYAILKKSYDKKNNFNFSAYYSTAFYSQNKETINWITYNSITIEDANPDSELMILRKTYLINLIPKFMGLGKHPQHKRIF
jgi:hypothetical protein